MLYAVAACTWRRCPSGENVIMFARTCLSRGTKRSRAALQQFAYRDLLLAFEPDGSIHGRGGTVRIGRRTGRRCASADGLAEEGEKCRELPAQFHKASIYSNLPRHPMSAPIAIGVTVNGVLHEREVEPRLLLSDFIRQDLALTGTHVGCEHGVCGACTVLFDGEPVRSCIMLAVQADGHDLQTVEALAGPAGRIESAAERFPKRPRPAVRVLHAGLPDDVDGVPARQPEPDRF